VGHIRTRCAHHGISLRQISQGREMVQGGNELAAAEIAGSAESDKRKGFLHFIRHERCAPTRWFASCPRLLLKVPTGATTSADARKEHRYMVRTCGAAY